MPSYLHACPDPGFSTAVDAFFLNELTLVMAPRSIAPRRIIETAVLRRPLCGEAGSAGGEADSREDRRLHVAGQGGNTSNHSEVNIGERSTRELTHDGAG